jgi:hypothetical protein
MKEYYANPQQRLAIKNRQKKVTRFKVFKQYKKALGQEGVLSAGSAVVGAPDIPRDVEPERKTGGVRKKRVGAYAAASQAWQSKRQAIDEQEAAARRLAEEQQREKEESRKRRQVESRHLSKRTRRGQPVLSHQVSKLLGRIERQQPPV